MQITTETKIATLIMVANQAGNGATITSFARGAEIVDWIEAGDPQLDWTDLVAVELAFSRFLAHQAHTKA